MTGALPPKRATPAETLRLDADRPHGGDSRNRGPALPTFQLGGVMPVLVSDFIHYQFYQICPPSCLLVCNPLRLNDFTRKGVDDALAAFWPVFDFLVARQVDRIHLAGVPISTLLGRERVLSLVAEGRSRSLIPFDTDFEESIAALRTLGAQKVAVAAKWDPPLMERIGTYLSHAGLSMVGYACEAHSAKEVIAITPEKGMDLALTLGRAALERHPEADALFLAGGSWLSIPAIRQLEHEFGKPVVSNTVASCWAALQQFGLTGRDASLGRLVDQLRKGDTRP